MTRLSNPDVSAAITEVWTFQDAVEHVVDFFDLEQTARNLRMARRAVTTAYRDLPFKHRWSYYDRLNSVHTQASGTLTAVYDHTGGAYERVLTATAGTWDANAIYGEVVLGNDRYDIATRESSTEITLSPHSNPGADVASGSVTWMRKSYPLGISFRRASPVVELAESWMLEYVTPATLHQLEVGNYQPSRPYAYTFSNTGEYYGSLSITFVPPPSESRMYEFMAEVAPRQLLTESVIAGTVTVSGNATTVTGTGTAFADAHIGSIIRISADGTSAPTSLVGSMLPDATGTDNPYVAQRVVTAVASATSLTIDSAMSSTTYTDVNYSISEPIDVEPGSMFTYFLRKIELEMARYMRSEDVTKFYEDELMALRHAMGSDHRNKDMGTGARPSRPTYYHNLKDWAVIV